ncbi:hypothetical protein A4H97_25900 [Niastella yeongjuensis]|uniref:TonB-dependent transporter Oar-like beta-barrel domain-containing protein n=2 Tax=Niastella yeongjuensis TaxID=354355 RepID=A0A1V9F1C2_9BACT|nr:hypothetical protein A4H97_25900 [Niastella yeongjuensis]
MAISYAQVTTSNMTGLIKTSKGEALSGASVVAVHNPTGTKYTTLTSKNGRFNLSNIQPGGPYTIDISYVGYSTEKRENVYLSLGETGIINIEMGETTKELSTVTVSGARRMQPVAKGGVESVIGRDKMQNAPSVGRNLADYFRLVPQAKTTFGGGISIAGQNNRYNQLMIDGATNNDNFGLSDQGTNGGQTGAPPISIDAIEAIQVGISPYDVSLGNFTGGTINAITKSGTNRFTGSAYYVNRNEGIAGKTPTGDKDNAKKLADFKSNTVGFTAGGPIIKNKLFFFVSGEIQQNTTPQPFDPGTFANKNFQDSVAQIVAKLKNDYKYDPGEYLNIPDKLKSNKIAGKLTWNINSKNRLNVSYRYTKSTRYLTSATTSTKVNFYNGGYLFPSTTNSVSAELNSNITNNISNKLLVTYTKVFDDRDPLGMELPRVTLNSANATSYVFGTENFSTANQLKQNNFNVYDEFKYTMGTHQLKAGIDVEASKSYNLFIGNSFGSYTYASVLDFLTDKTPSGYSRSFSLLDNINGDGSAAAPTFKTLRLGFFLGDDWNVSNNLKLNYGVRFDNFTYLDKPNTDTFFNNMAVPAISQYYDMQGARSGQKPNSVLSVSPRIGFTYSLPAQNMRIRGGVGLFTGRVPLVWPGGMYNNSGVTVGGISFSASATNPMPAKIKFQPDVNSQYTPLDFGQTVKVPSGEIDLIAKNLKLPKVLKTSIGVDKTFGDGFNLSADLLFQKNINEIIYINALAAPGGKNSFGQDVYLTSALKYNTIDMDPNTAGVQNPYSTGIFIIENAKKNKGYAYNASAVLDKTFAGGWNANVSYSYGDSYALFDGTSSQNSSQWRYMETSTGRNALTRSRSDFAQKHRINAYVSKKFEYAGNLATTVTLFYNGQSGTPFSYVYSRSMLYDYGGMNAETNDLIYIPKDEADWDKYAKDWSESNGTVHTVQEQWEALNSFIDKDKYLSKHRGEFAKRNGGNLPFSHQLDLTIRQDFILKTKESKNTLSVQFDMFNFSNFLNRNWGRIYATPGVDQYSLISMDGYTLVNGVYQPSLSYRNLSNRAPYDVLDVRSNAYNASRWRGQLTVRYTFN